MKSFNTYYDTPDTLQLFLESYDIRDNSRLLVQVFTALQQEEAIKSLQATLTAIFPKAALIGTTTDGEICSGHVSLGKTVISLTQFEQTELKVALVEGCEESKETGVLMAKRLLTPDTKLLITFSDGLHCNGEAYLKGLASLNQKVNVAGGMSGDGGTFVATYVFTKENLSSHGAVGVGLDNKDLNVYTTHSFNWLSVGKRMRITKVDKNRVFMIDHINAKDIYKKYLGTDVAENLPIVGVEFPLIIQNRDQPVARAVVAKNDDGSLSFAGDFVEGDEVCFGYGDVDMILERSKDVQKELIKAPVEAIFVYSCMARRRFMPDQIEEEILPLNTFSEVSGFFTYGEFYTGKSSYELMNQTMTIVAISESPQLQEYPTNITHRETALNPYQKSVKALSHLLNVTTKELAEENREHQERTKLIAAKEESLRLAQRVGHFGSWEIDLITHQSIWSEESFHIYHMDPKGAQPTLETFLSRVVLEDQEKLKQAMIRLEDGHVHSETLRAKRDDGVIITVLLNAKKIFNSDGKAVKMIGTTLDITEVQQLQKENIELVKIIEHSLNEIYVIDRESYQYLYANEEALQRLSYTLEEMLEMSIYDTNAGLTPERVQQIRLGLEKENALSNRTVHVRKDGTTYPVQSYLQRSTYYGKEVIIIFDVDISALVEIETKEKQKSQILEQIHDSVVTTNLNGIITHWNHGATTIHGYSEEEMIGEHLAKLYLPEDIEKSHWMCEEALAHGVHHDQIRKVSKSGDIVYTDITVSVVKDSEGKPIGITRYSQDITQKREIENQLKEQTKLLNFQAFHDPLTHLPNRALFNDRIEQSIASASRHGSQFALLFIDLDNFKQINDTLGHHYGDEVLKEVAQRLSLCTREEDTLSRLGGDEFTVILQNLNTSESAAVVAQKIIQTLKPKLMIDRHELHISASIGISLFPQDATSKHDLLKYADSAMYKAKDKGRDNFQFYSSDMTQLAFEKAAMESSMHLAVEKEQFEVFYQPQVDARSNRLIGMEALVRWRHPTLGLIAPDKFIPLAEETGFIRNIDSYVMKKAMYEVCKWRKAGLNPGVLSLNLSMKQLMSSDFLALLEENIEKTGFNVKWLELEITESQMMLDPMKSIEILEQLSQKGIEIAIDDFGTGYSSLAYLKRLPVNKLKIDRSFIKDLPNDDEDCAISRAVIALADSLNLSIIAEGVENREQINYLVENGCHHIQGFYYSKAINQEDMTTYLENE